MGILTFPGPDSSMYFILRCDFAKPRANSFRSAIFTPMSNIFGDSERCCFRRFQFLFQTKWVAWWSKVVVLSIVDRRAEGWELKLVETKILEECVLYVMQPKGHVRSVWFSYIFVNCAAIQLMFRNKCFMMTCLLWINLKIVLKINYFIQHIKL